MIRVGEFPHALKSKIIVEKNLNHCNQYILLVQNIFCYTKKILAIDFSN